MSQNNLTIYNKQTKKLFRNITSCIKNVYFTSQWTSIITLPKGNIFYIPLYLAKMGYDFNRKKTEKRHININMKRFHQSFYNWKLLINNDRKWRKMNRRARNWRCIFVFDVHFPICIIIYIYLSINICTYLVIYWMTYASSSVFVLFLFKFQIKTQNFIRLPGLFKQVSLYFI